VTLDPDQALSRLPARENPSDLVVVQHTVGPRPDELLLPSLSVTAQISTGFSLGAVIRRGRPDPQSDDAGSAGEQPAVRETRSPDRRRDDGWPGPDTPCRPVGRVRVRRVPRRPASRTASEHHRREGSLWRVRAGCGG
jgi:hypothetical protein